jgi:hypothetical protein
MSPEERKAQRLAGHLLRRAIRSKKIRVGCCEVCRTRRFIEGHHEDYSKPLEVVWLCRQHHREIHIKHDPWDRDKGWEEAMTLLASESRSKRLAAKALPLPELNTSAPTTYTSFSIPYPR